MDQEVLCILEACTKRVKVGKTLEGCATAENRCSTERQLLKDSAKAEVYEAEIQKFIDGGSVTKLQQEEFYSSSESWFIPHHLVYRNDKPGLHLLLQSWWSVSQQAAALGPTLGLNLVGVLLQFCQHSVAISGDIQAMFHLVRLLPEDQPLLRFVWRNLQSAENTDIYQWQVFPFGTTSSPCCATSALQKHVKESAAGNEGVLQSIEQSFYMDNCLQSASMAESAKLLVDNMQQCLS